MATSGLASRLDRFSAGKEVTAPPSRGLDGSPEPAWTLGERSYVPPRIEPLFLSCPALVLLIIPLPLLLWIEG